MYLDCVSGQWVIAPYPGCLHHALVLLLQLLQHALCDFTVTAQATKHHPRA